MSKKLPPLDLHAHIDSAIAPRDLEALGAVVFAATRSVEEFARVSDRADAVTVWGIGCHPGVAAAQERYDENAFAKLLTKTPFVSEIGLDGGSPVPMERQKEVFRSVLHQVARTPRLVSIHSKRATAGTLDLIESSGVEGAILHWWLGSEAETRRALGLGCLFSVNRSMDVERLKAAGVTLSSILPETDHPTGNRRGDGLKQPGWTVDVEQSVAVAYGMTQLAVRDQFWNTLVSQVRTQGVTDLLPPVVRAMAAQAQRRR